MGYRVRITAGGVSRWIADENAAFTDVEAEAAMFDRKQTFGDFNRYVLNEITDAPFFNNKTYEQIGLEKIEFIYS